VIGTNGGTPTRPKALAVRQEHIPDELKALAWWVVWLYVQDVDPETGEVEYDKPPRNARTGGLASSTNPKTWSPFAVAIAAYLAGGLDGIGIALDAQQGEDGLVLVAIDLDHCRDPQTGAIAEWAQEIIDAIASYTEVSPSGCGIRIFLRGRPLARGRKRGGVEVYCRGRYVTVTGQHVAGTPRAVESRPEALLAFLASHFPEPEEESGPRPEGAGAPVDLDDAELVRRAGEAKNGAKFRRLWEGDHSGYNSRSEADLALCSLLAFWTGGSRNRIAGLFAQSGLFRSKWKREDYQQRTIGKALAGSREFYSGPRANGAGANGHGGGTGGADVAPNPAHLSDTGNALRFTRDHGADLRHCHPWRKWLCWDGRRWGLDETGEAMRRAKATVKGLYDWAEAELKRLKEQGAEDKEEAAARLKAIEAILKWALHSEAAPRLVALLDLARSELPVLPAGLDRDPFVLNVANGTLDLRTARLRPHRREDLLTKLCPTAFDPDADCPVFLRAVDGIFGGDRELIRYVQRFGGYALTGDVREHVIPIAHGPGGNGKTLLFSALLDTVGADYSGTVPPELLMETRGEQHPTIMADLFGKRLMVAAETGEGRRLNEGRLKALTGGDRIKARRMKEDFWEFTPTHKLVLFTNHKPEVRGTDHGIWRRLALWPFGVRFWDHDKGETGPPELRADKDLPNKLRAERPGILAWLVAGCLEWQAEGLRMPEKVRAATAEYRDAQDVLAAFLADCCLTGPDYRSRATPLYEAYTRWAKSAGEHEVSQRRFGDAMTERGYDRYTNDGTWYRGVTLRTLQGSVGG
jgi:putative DNA primase/helicase